MIELFYFLLTITIILLILKLFFSFAYFYKIDKLEKTEIDEKKYRHHYNSIFLFMII